MKGARNSVLIVLLMSFHLFQNEKKKIELTLVAEKIRAKQIGNTGFRGKASSGDHARSEGKVVRQHWK